MVEILPKSIFLCYMEALAISSSFIRSVPGLAFLMECSETFCAPQTVPDCAPQCLGTNTSFGHSQSQQQSQRHSYQMVLLYNTLLRCTHGLGSAFPTLTDSGFT